MGNGEDRAPEHEDVWLHHKVDSPENLDLAIEGVRGILRSRHGLRADEDDNFSIMTPDVLADIWSQISGGLFVLLFSVASVALLVGGIGVMNIMLMSVTERTHEIGVRKAMGATRFDILRQFTIEAMIKEISYTLEYDYERDNGFAWAARPNNDITVLEGSYEFNALDDGAGTEVVYALRVEPTFKVPGFLRRQAEKQIVGTALRGLKNQAEASA